MGLEIQHVLSDEPHHGAFLCAICTNLVGLDAIVTTECSHVFCRLCLETWFSRPRPGTSNSSSTSNNKCPTCNQEQPVSTSSSSTSTSTSLRSAQPVAHRVLSRIQVSCPLRHVQCAWKGDYGDLQTHLVSSTAHSVMNGGDGGSLVVETIVKDDDDVTMLFNDNDYSTAATATAVDLAKSFKEEANTKFASNNFQEARDLYTKGIDVLQTNDNDTTSSASITTKQLTSILYANRAAVASKLEQFELCIDDCHAAIALDAAYTKAYTRRYKANLELGHFQEAVQGLEEGCAANRTSALLVRELQQAIMIRDSFEKAQTLLLQQQKSTNANANANATTAQQLLSSLLQHHTKAPCVVIAAARAHLQLGGLATAQRLSLQLLRRYPQAFPEAYLVRGHSLVLGGDLEQGLKVMREGLRLDPDMSRESKGLLRACQQLQKSVLAARQAIFYRHFTKAVEAFGRALQELQQIDNSCIHKEKTPLYAKLHAERAEAHLRLKDYKSALKDASIALYARDDLEQAWLIKTKAYHGLGRHEEARDELQDLLQNKWGANHDSIRKAYERADFLLRQEQRPDFYKLLGLSSIASLMEIKKQYKVKAMEYHPDRLVSKSPQLQKEAEHNFKLLGQGLEVLSDDFQRQLYDEGYDPEAIRERVAAAQQAAHRSQNRGHHGYQHGGHGGGGQHRH